MRLYPPHPPVLMHQPCMIIARASEMKGSRITREEDKQHGPQILLLRVNSSHVLDIDPVISQSTISPTELPPYL